MIVFMLKQLRLIIHGTVQGVNFRWFIKTKATHLGLVGFVQNRENQTVEAIAQGEERILQKLLCACKTGSPDAKVGKIEEDWQELSKESFEGFSIIYAL